MAENLKSTPVTNNDASPIVTSTAGEGIPGVRRVVSDNVDPTASTAQYSTYRLARFPTTARVKKVQLYTSGIEAQTTAHASIDLNVAFSDSTTDGTPVSYIGAIPSNKKNGEAYTFVSGTGYSTAYSSTGTGNKLFGAALSQGTAGAVNSADVTFANTTAAEGFFPVDKDKPMWSVLGFTNARGVGDDPGGKFDILAVISGALTTAAAGVIGVEVDFVG